MGKDVTRHILVHWCICITLLVFFTPFLPFCCLYCSHCASHPPCFLHFSFCFSCSLNLPAQIPLPLGSSRWTQTSSGTTVQWVFSGLWGKRHARLDPREKGRKHWCGIRWCLGTAEKVWWVSNGKNNLLQTLFERLPLLHFVLCLLLCNSLITLLKFSLTFPI